MALGMVAACSKKEAPAPAPAPSATEAPLATPAPSAAEAPSAVATPQPTPSGAPESFKAGTKENIAGAVGLGCEATSLDGWLQLLCRKKNGTGGHPVRALLATPGEAAPEGSTGQEPSGEVDAGDAGAGQEISTNEHGELTLVVPFSGDQKRDVTIEWTDTTYTLHVTGAKATLEWAASGIAHRRACQQVLDETKAVIAAAQKAEGEARLTTTEASKLPRFGVCQPAGLGSWAVALKAVSGKGEGSARRHHFELEAVRVALDGARKSAPLGNVDAAPGGFELAGLQVYDFDDDGRDELIVPYELKSTGGSAPPDTLPPPIWSFSDTGVAPYAKAPNVVGGIGVEQLDFDMRPDLGSYGGFVAYLGADCGLRTCPARLTGPKLYMHATPEGTFTESDETARSALKRASCQSKPTSIVVEAGGSLNAAQTAKNLVCARAYGIAADTILSELSTKHAAVCGEAATCPLFSTLEAWANQSVPLDLSITPEPPKSAKGKSK